MMGKKKKKVRHAYLEEFGWPRKRCGTNFTSTEDYMLQEQRKYGFDRRETYNLGDMFAQWLYERLRMYLDVASKKIDIDSEYPRIMINDTPSYYP